MQRTSFAYIALVMALFLASCTSDTPTEAASDADDVMVSLVSASVGYESNGFAAMLEDAVSVAAGKRVATAERQGPDTAVAVMANGGNISLIGRDHNQERSSEWRSAYHLRPAVAGSNAVIVDASCDGLFRSDAATLQGVSRGDFSVERPSDSSLRSARVNGSYLYNGSAIFHNGQEYSSVQMAFNWNRLSVGTNGAGRQEIIGQVDVSISAQSAEGTTSRNLRLIFNGTDRAMVIAGGRQHVLAIQ